MATNEAEVGVVSREGGITQGCKICRTILREGVFAIGLILDGEGGKKEFLLGEDPPVVCCGEEKAIFRTFSTVEEAETVRDEVLERLRRQGSTEGLRLVSWTFPGLN